MIRLLAMHSWLSVLKLLDYKIPLIRSYFVLGLAGGGSCAQKPVVLPVSIQHVQRPPQCTVALHVLPQKPGAPVFNCRAETVPAHRTAAAIAARIVLLIVLLMILFSISVTDKWLPQATSPRM